MTTSRPSRSVWPREYAASRLAQITPKAREQARSCILDTVGVALAGVKEPCTELLRQVPGVGGAPGPCLIFGSDQRTSALDATLINGTASHALDYDDFSAVMGGASFRTAGTPCWWRSAKSAASRGSVPCRLCRRSRGRDPPRSCGELPPLRQGLASDVDARDIRRNRRRVAIAWPRPGEDRDGALHCRVAGERHQGQFRDVGQASARRPMRAQRAFRGVTRRARLRCGRRRLRA